MSGKLYLGQREIVCSHLRQEARVTRALPSTGSSLAKEALLRYGSAESLNDKDRLYSFVSFMNSGWSWKRRKLVIGGLDKSSLILSNAGARPPTWIRFHSWA